MTVIAAALTGDHVTLAADSQASAGWEKAQLDGSKLFTAEKFAIGGAGTLRDIQVLKHQVTWPKYRPDEDKDWEKYLVTVVVPAIRSGCNGHGIVKNDSGVESIAVQIIVAAKDKLATIDSHGGVTIQRVKRGAVGSGYAEALGRLGDKGPWTEADVIDAVRRAAYSARGVGGPITVVNTGDLTIRTVNGNGNGEVS